ncbi:uncharacterized protein JN550_005267 [Neoarthrinium moseri]|uniref:uncharacterized protein n=1 Tax=Neoarthrinium moseri TaxID=1658444 RepID=UPI001FDCD3B4|nr:uncharacterized protein JN550_005267 [Neoarthrinium moseri]KAI1870339.1 hypothetical protein JN550_005267 [Neoarthrinium moseri]
MTSNSGSSSYDETREALLIHEKYRAEECRLAELPSGMQKSRYVRRLSSAFAVVGWFLVITLAFYIITQGKASCGLGVSQPIWSPVEHLIEYKLVGFYSGLDRSTDPYKGDPSQEQDDNWNELYQKVFIPTKEELTSHGFPESGITPNPDDEEKEWWSVYVFHQLHCLNLLRMSLFPDYYNRTNDPLLSVTHLQHCVETLRRSLLCASDTTPFSFRYINSTMQTHEWDRAPHVCKNFEKIHAAMVDLPGLGMPSNPGYRPGYNYNPDS